MTKTHWAMLLVVVGQSARAHDLWLIPNIKANADGSWTIRAHSGMDFPKSEHAPDPATFAKRRVIGPNGSAGILDPWGTEELSGLMRFKPDLPGLYSIAVETKPKLITLDAAAFNAYLVSDGLSHIYQLRSKEKTLDQPGRERYSKSPKALVRIGDGGRGDPTKPIGLPLEIVPLNDPFSLKVGATLKVRVLFLGKPLGGAILGWDHPADGEPPSGTVRTDDKGEAMVPIAKTGLMTIRLTHMTRPKVKDYEWESFWTTLTFRIPD